MTKKGYKLTEEHRANISTAMKAYSQTPEGKANMLKMKQAAHAATGPTKLERALYRMLDVFGWEYETEKFFSPYHVDAYIPGLHLALEADGFYHFEGSPWKGTTLEEEAQKTKERDAYLLERYDLQVWHFTAEQLNTIPMFVKETHDESRSGFTKARDKG